MMKGRWVYLVLAVSVALNLAVFGTLAYYRYRRWRWQQSDFRYFAQRLTPRLTPILDQHRFKMDSLRIEYWKARQELARLGFAEKPDPIQVQKTLERIGFLHQEMHRQVFEMGRQSETFLPPPYREMVRRRYCEMMEGPYPPPRREMFHRPGWKRGPRRF